MAKDDKAKQAKDDGEKLPDGVNALDPIDDTLASVGVDNTAKYDDEGKIIPGKVDPATIPEADKDENKAKNNAKAEVPRTPKSSVSGMKQCQGAHDMWPDNDENFPPEAPHLGRYSADFIKRKLNPVKGENVPIAPRKADPDRVIKR